ncbi:hypothetical protein ACIQI7_22385 [Kitasatospora sp. NPDC092039]|uniref:hypothetical protein n=1 Tax=Kitasatospora sp. NPDC092039 TaxID=3364086 RepID=UPI00380AF540
MKNPTIPVVIAAGGLGTRVAGWSRLLPKEFRPVGGQPGLLHVLEEAVAGGAERAVVVHHPYYAGFYAWPCHALSPDAHRRYQEATGTWQIGPQPAAGLDVEFMAQRGRYADLTSVLNGSVHLRTGNLAFAFADNVDVTHSALATLLEQTDPEHPAVLTAPFDVAGAAQHGVVMCTGTGPVRIMAGLVEKPGPVEAARLLDEHGPDNLRLLQGRGRTTPGLVHHFAATARHAGRAEPKLSLAVAGYARNHVVQVVTGELMVDLGAPEPAAEVGVV